MKTRFFSMPGAIALRDRPRAIVCDEPSRQEQTAREILAQMRQTLALMRRTEEEAERHLFAMVQCRRRLEARIDGLAEAAVAVEEAS